MSSARNWSKLLPVPGNTITLGPLGTLTQAPSRSAAARTGENRRRFMVRRPASTAGRGLRRHALPACGAFLDVRVIGLGFGTVIPIALRLLRRRGLRTTLFDIRRRRRRCRDDRGIVIGVVGRVIPGIERSADEDPKMHAPVMPGERRRA